MHKGKKIIRKLLALVGVMFGITLCSAPVFAGNYYGSNAAVYALTYCDSYNSSYVSYDHDCVNFVSQCLLAGGWTEVGKYSYYSSSSWYYDGGTSPWVSNSWRLVEDFKDFIEGSTRAMGPVTVNSSTISMFDVGDVLIVDWENDGNWDHVYIVTGETTNPNDLELSAHTTDRCGDITTAEIWDDYYPNAVIVGYMLYSTF